jgi:hypothetical protein
VSISYLYVIGSENSVKIGFSKRPESRLKQLQTANGEALKLHHKEAFDERRIRLYEKAIHKELSHKKMKGEWFDLSPDDAVLHVKHLRMYYEDQETLLAHRL